MNEAPGMKTQTPDARGFYVWFDTEYSSLEIGGAVLLQVAALVTDTSLRRVLPPDRDIRLIIRPPEGTKLSPWVEQNLPDLVKACRSAEAVSVAEAGERLADYVDAAVGSPAEREDHRPVLAGNSIHFDWLLIRRFLPHFLSRLHYRQLDVSAFKLEWKRLHPDEEFDKGDPEIIRTCFPEAVLTGSGSRHDAYYDLQASIAELAFYRQHLFGR
jgi:oligoribonuclease